MRRRALLRASAVPALAGLAGCLSSLLGPASPSVRWRTDLSLRTTPRARLAANEGALYVETRGGIVGLDPDTGERRWPIDYPSIAGVHESTLFAADGDAVAAIPAAGTVAWTARGRYLGAGGPSVFVLDGSAGGSPERPLFRALDPHSGEVRWRYRFDRPVSPFARAHAADLVYLVDVAGGAPRMARVTALDPGSATAAWTREIAPARIPQSVAHDDGVVVGTERPSDDAAATVAALDSDGATRWRRRWDRTFAFPRATDGFATVVELATTREGGSRTTVLLGGIAPGDTRWRAPGRFVAVRRPAPTADATGEVLLLSDNALVARGMEDGTQRHRVAVGDHLSAGEGSDRALRATAGEQTVYVASGRKLLAADFDEGVRWTFAADRPVWLLGVVDGVAYAGTSGAVHALAPP